MTLVIEPVTETGTVPPFSGALTVPTIFRLISTVPVPFPAGVVKVTAPLLVVIVNAVEVTGVLVIEPLLLRVIVPL